MGKNKLTQLETFSAPIHRYPLHWTGGKWLNNNIYLCYDNVTHSLREGRMQDIVTRNDCFKKTYWYCSIMVSVLDCFSTEGSWYQEYPCHNGSAWLQRQILPFQHHGYTRYVYTAGVSGWFCFSAYVLMCLGRKWSKILSLSKAMWISPTKSHLASGSLMELCCS